MIRSLVWSTDIDVLQEGHLLARRDAYWVVHSPDNPTFWWGNFLLFDDPPAPGDGVRWEAIFAAEFAQAPGVKHRTFAWDRIDGSTGVAEAEFVAHGYKIEPSTGLIAAPAALTAHPRESREVEVRQLDPEPGADEQLWAQVIEVQAPEPVAGSSGDYRLDYLRRRQAAHRRLFAQGRGAWFVALDGEQVVGSLGVVVTDGRARYQAVDTLASHRGRGIASRLIVEAARLTAAAHTVEHFVIVADPDYHAIGIYESLGFSAIEQVCGVQKLPPGDDAPA